MLEFKYIATETSAPEHERAFSELTEVRKDGHFYLEVASLIISVMD